MITVPATLIFQGKIYLPGPYQPEDTQDEANLLKAISHYESKQATEAKKVELVAEENGDKKYSEEEHQELVDEAVANACSELNNVLAEKQTKIDELEAKIVELDKKLSLEASQPPTAKEKF